jgi:hypothetical protein
MCFYALAADFAAGAVAPALTLMQYQFVTHESISRLSQLVAVSIYLLAETRLLGGESGESVGLTIFISI